MSDQESNNWDFVIHTYTLEQAIEDGVLVEVFKERWPELSSGRPIVATAAIYAELSQAALIEIWNAYVDWIRNVHDDLPEEERMFTTKMNNRVVWVITDAVGHTLLFPSDY